MRSRVMPRQLKARPCTARVPALIHVLSASLSAQVACVHMPHKRAPWPVRRARRAAELEAPEAPRANACVVCLCGEAVMVCDPCFHLVYDAWCRWMLGLGSVGTQKLSFLSARSRSFCACASLRSLYLWQGGACSRGPLSAGKLNMYKLSSSQAVLRMLLSRPRSGPSSLMLRLLRCN